MEIVLSIEKVKLKNFRNNESVNNNFDWAAELGDFLNMQIME
jgi:hypothetical protein